MRLEQAAWKHVPFDGMYVVIPDGGQSGGLLPNASQGQDLRFSGSGVWIAAPITQPSWFVDSVNGSDAADGATAATALRSLTELALRMSGATITTATTITLSGDFSAQPLELELTIASGVLVTIQGEVTVADSGTITAVTAAVPTTNTRGQITDATQAFTDKSRIKLTSGAISGSIAYVTRVIAATNVNVSAWALLSDPLASQLPSIGTPAIGNAYNVETLATTVGRVDVQVHGTGRLVFKDLVLSPATSGAHRATNDSTQLANVMFWGCRFASPQTCLFYDSIACFVSCAWDVTSVLVQSIATMRATSNRGLLKADLGSEVQFARSCNFDGGQLWVSGHSEATITGTPADVEFSDITADAAVTVDPASVIDANIANSLLWGTDNVLSWAFLMRSHGVLCYTTGAAPAISGAGVADISLGGTNTAYAALPAVNAANLAAVVERI